MSINQKTKKLNFFYQNCQGLNTKIHSFKLSLGCADYDIIILTETWISPGVFDNELFDSRYNVFRKDRNFELTKKDTGGGVLVAVKTEYECQLLSESCGVDGIDDVWLRVRFFSKDVYVYAVYIPPKMSLECYQGFFENLDINVIKFGLDEKYLFIGDFNIPGVVNVNKNTNLSGIENLYVQFINFLGLTQYNNVLNNKGRFLDLIMSNVEISLERCESGLVEEHADHPPLFFQLHLFLSVSTSTKTFNAQYNYKKADFLKLYTLLNLVDWSELTLSNDINVVVNKFYKIFYGILDQCVPLARYKARAYPTWYTREIILDIQRKDRNRKNYAKSKIEFYQQNYLYLRAKIKRDVRAAHVKYIRSIENNIQGDTNEFWRFTKDQRSNSKGLPTIMSCGAEQISGNVDIANKFADYFRSVYSVDKSSYGTHFVSNDAYTNTVLRVDFVSESDILEAVKKMKPKKSVGPDGIPPYIFKACIHQLMEPLKLCFNLILETQIYPEMWKKSKICPIFKSDKKCEISNYRPVAIICAPSKILESILYKYIFSHISEVIDSNQHGFLPRRSTETNLTSFLHKINDAVDINKQIDVIFTDFSKAFDRVDHDVLLKKLDAFGVSFDLLRLSASYLADRIMYVVYNGVQSYEFSPLSGVPQGSNLGPLFFLCLINDLPRTLKNSSCELFADDFKFYRTIEGYNDCLLLQNDITKVLEWAKLNKLDFNVKKCFKLTFSRKKNITNFNYIMNNTIIDTKHEIKDLGITLDAKLSFEAHISNVTKKSYTMLGFILRNGSNFQQLKTFENLYNAYVRSSLEYASFVWSPLYNKYIEELEKIQKKFLRYLYYKKYGTYIFDIGYQVLLTEFGCVTLETRRKQYALTFLFKLIHYRIDSPYLLSNINLYVNPYFNNRNNIFYMKKCRTNLGLNSPLYRVCHIANSIKNYLDLFQYVSLNTFKKSLKKINF